MSKSQEFNYSEFRGRQGDSGFRPFLPLILEYQQQSIEVQGLLDSGADVNVLPYQLGITLGANWEETQTALQLSSNLANFEARGLLLNATIPNFPTVRLAFAWTKAENIPLIWGK